MLAQIKGEVWTLGKVQGIFMLCFIDGMTMIFVSPNIGVHEKLDLILNQTESKFFTKMARTKSF